MSDTSPEAVARDFCANFGPTYEDAVATCTRLVHQNVSWEAITSVGAPVESRDQLLGDLERARSTMGAEGFGIDLHHIAVTGNVVLMQRTDKVLDKNGDLLTSLDLMAIFRVEDGQVTWSRDYFFDSRAFVEGWAESDQS
jgi:limonene-1,2-epoxide hydrolase